MTIKHENFTPGIWHECGALVTGDDGFVILRAAEHLSAGEASANTQRIVACVNAFAGIETERIYGKDIGEILAGEVRLNKAEPTEDGGFSFSFSGGFIQLMANAYAEQFKHSGAINYLELVFQHHELGQLNVTMQRVNGLTPAQKLAQAEAELDKLAAECAAMRADYINTPTLKRMGIPVGAAIDAAIASIQANALRDFASVLNAEDEHEGRVHFALMARADQLEGKLEDEPGLRGVKP